MVIGDAKLGLAPPLFPLTSIADEALVKVDSPSPLLEVKSANSEGCSTLSKLKVEPSSKAPSSRVISVPVAEPELIARVVLAPDATSVDTSTFFAICSVFSEVWVLPHEVVKVAESRQNRRKTF